MSWVHARVQVGPLTVLPSGLLLLAALDGTTGLSRAAGVTGGLVSVTVWVLVDRAMRRDRMRALGAANAVTMLRAVLVVGVTALVVDSWSSPVPRTLVVGLAGLALILDLLDGWLARTRGEVTRLGAAFDMETDAWLILVLSVYVVPLVGAWVLLIGLARYLFFLAGLVRPWLLAPAPPRRWAKIVAAVQGVVLVVVAADVLRRGVAQAATLVALALLVESFAHQAVVLRRHRHEQVMARPRALRPILDVFAVLLVWLALVLPHRPDQLGAAALVAIPVELLVFVALAVVLPTVWGRVLAVAGGVLLAATVVVSVLDLAFFEAFDRPFDPMTDPSYTFSGLDLLHRTLGSGGRAAVVAVIIAILLAAAGVCVWAALRVRRAAHGAPRAWSRAVVVLTAVWTVAGVGGAHIGTIPVAAAPAASLVRSQVDQVQADLHDQAMFEKALAHDPYAHTPGRDLLTALRGKDVLVVFVESYGRVALDGSWFAPQVQATVDRATTQIARQGFHARSGWLRSPTFGGISWLAHSTLQSGLWVDSQQRYDDVLSRQRLTLTSAFHRAGWRTVDDVPSDPAGWPQGKRFYHYDRMYGASDVGYHGRSFSYAAVPDQYTFRAFTQRELRRPDRGPVMAEIDLVSSHTPWTPLPHIVPWRTLGDGSVYDSMGASQPSLFRMIGDGSATQADYARSIQYSLRSLVSFVQHAHDNKLVMVVLGDHQPHTVVSGTDASHDVPISLIAHDPRVLRRINGWGWSPGLRPASDLPVVRMDRFRDRFLAAFGSHPTSR